MSNAEIIYAAVIVLVGLPAALRISLRPPSVGLVNLTAAALVASYAFMQGSYYGFGLAYPPIISTLVDITVIALIYCKPPIRGDLWPYLRTGTWFGAFWLERSFWDRLVIALFPVGWAFYAFARDPWWPLYWISLAQLLAAGFEAFEKYRSTRTAKRASAPDPPSGFLFAPGPGWRGYG